MPGDALMKSSTRSLAAGSSSSRRRQCACALTIDLYRRLARVFDYKHGEDMSKRRVDELLAKKQRSCASKATTSHLVLDRLNIEIMLANRPSRGRGLARPRFRRVAYGDALMLPLKTNSLRVDSDKKFFYGREEILLKRHLAASGVKELPATLDRYLATIVKPTLAQLKSDDAMPSSLSRHTCGPLSSTPSH